MLRGVLVLFAFLLLGTVEVSLRLLGVAAPEPLLLRKQQGPLDVYQLNPRVGLRYFPAELERIMPKPGFQFFAADKAEETIRIFVLGGSTTAGFPYPLHGSFVNLLRVRLGPHLPGHHLEVVNCGLTALNSYAVLDFVEELSDHEPDLYVVYAGHNEFYGALGPASRAAFGRSQSWVRPLRWVFDLRISRLLSRALDSARGDPAKVEGQTLMGAMVGQTGIRRDDPTWNATLAGFEANLEQIVRAADGVPVLFCEVVSNLRDQYPFESLHRPDLPEEEAAEFDRTLARLRSAVVALGPSEGWSVGEESTVSENRLTTALDGEVARLREVDPEHAAAVFVAARAALHRWATREGKDLPKFEAAPESIGNDFVLARDLDAIRFRAPSEVNEILQAVVARSASSGTVRLVPTHDAVASRSLYGIPGSESFVEHLHLTLQGSDTVAGAIVETIGSEGILGSAWTPRVAMSSDSAISRLGLTPLDLEIAERRVFHLTHRWPYPEDRSATFRSARDRLVQDLAESVIGHEIDLAEAHFRLGENWFAEGRRPEALRELITACEVFPVVPSRFLLAGRLALEEGATELALDLLTRGEALDPTDGDLVRWRERASQAASRTAPGSVAEPAGRP